MKRLFKDGALAPSPTVLLLVDFINPLDFPGAERLADAAVQAAGATVALKASLRAEAVTAIYCNDNFGVWQSDFKRLVHRCAASKGPSAELVRLLRPRRGDFTILKPRHSAFYGSPLQLLLDQMNTEKVIITGLACDSCVQMTAMDAFLRGFEVQVPSNCTAAESKAGKARSLQYMQQILKCDITPLPAPP